MMVFVIEQFDIVFVSGFAAVPVMAFKDFAFRLPVRFHFSDVVRQHPGVNIRLQSLKLSMLVI
ncbi:hypothetical protein [Sphingobacterium sp.]|uniref:hypothetical protein n=1 Tax=Sphingobacterium sp. TaxID=341027 RepID=UPI00289BDEB0|nr:hypothetical protein [Sphingobacterium sp.]